MKKVYLLIALLMMVMAGLLPACSESNDLVHVNANIKELSLVEIWEAIEEKTEVQEMTANLNELIIEIDEEGVINLLHYMFHARDADGKAGMYFVNSEFDGDVTYYCHPADDPVMSTGTHPLGVFEQLDGVPVATVLSGEASAHVLMDFMSGTVRYSSSVSLIRLNHLNDGELVPLEDVMFRTSVPWGVIRVTKGAATATELWFLTSELGKAESVKYA